jgi:hypothetical protein
MLRDHELIKEKSAVFENLQSRAKTLAEYIKLLDKGVTDGGAPELRAVDSLAPR